MSDIFISYAREDRERILPLVRALEEAGWSVFWDRTIPISKTWQQVIGKEVDECRCMIVAWSSASVESEWVYEEAGEGKRRQILFPLIFDDTLPPLGFRSIQAGDLSKWDGKEKSTALKKLIQDLSEIIGEPPNHSETKQQAEEERQSTALEAKRKAEEVGRHKLEEAKREEETKKRLEVEAEAKQKEIKHKKAEAAKRSAEQVAHRTSEEARPKTKESLDPYSQTKSLLPHILVIAIACGAIVALAYWIPQQMSFGYEAFYEIDSWQIYSAQYYAVQFLLWLAFGSITAITISNRYEKKIHWGRVAVLSTGWGIIGLYCSSLYFDSSGDVLTYYNDVIQLSLLGVFPLGGLLTSAVLYWANRTLTLKDLAIVAGGWAIAVGPSFVSLEIIGTGIPGYIISGILAGLLASAVMFRRLDSITKAAI